MRDAEFYKLLSGTDDRETKWAKSAEQFLKLKIASGGLTQHQVDTLRKVAFLRRRLQEALKTAGVADVQDESSAPTSNVPGVEVSPEETVSARKKGLLAGIRSQVMGDMSRAEGVRRKRGEDIGKLLGTLGGGAGGALLGRRLLGSPMGPIGTIAGMAAGALGGNMLGKTVGSEIDRQRMLQNFQPKEAEILKETEKASDFDKESMSTGELLSKLKPSGGGEEAVKGLQSIAQWARTKGSATAAQVADELKRAKEMSKYWSFDQAKTAAVRARLRTKLAQEDQGMAVQPKSHDIPGVIPKHGLESVTPPELIQLEQFFQAQQEANEAEFFRQRAEEAQAQASQLQEQAEMLQLQNQQTQQESQAQTEQAAQQAQQAQSESQMAKQDAMQARDESLQYQQKNLEIRNAVTQYRQQLMDLLSQDPLMAMGAPTVPTDPAPMPPQAGPPGAEQGGPPGAEGGAPGPGKPESKKPKAVPAAAA